MNPGDLVQFKNQMNGHPKYGVILQSQYDYNRRRREVLVMWSEVHSNWSYGWMCASWIEVLREA